MRVSRTRFSKRRLKRKTEFPIVAVVQKKRKSPSIKPTSFSILHKVKESKKTSPQAVSFENKIQQQSAFSSESPSLFSHNENSKKNVQSIKFEADQSESSPFAGRKPNVLSSKGSRAEDIKQNKNGDDSPSHFCSAKTRTFRVPQKKSRATIDYKNIILLRNLITAEGKILPRRINKLTAKQQRSVQKAIKSARIMGLIPFINKSRPF